MTGPLVPEDVTAGDFKPFWMEQPDHHDRLVEAAEDHPETRSVRVDWGVLANWDHDLAQFLLEYPSEATDFMESGAGQALGSPAGSLNVRPTNLPDDRSYRVGKVLSVDLGELVSIDVKCIDMEGVQPYATSAAFECDRCGTMSRMPQPGGNLREPAVCPGCDSTRDEVYFRFEQDASTIVDHQEVVVITPGSSLDEPPEETMFLRRDLVNSVGPGDVVTVVGVWETFPSPSEAILDTYIQAYALAGDADAETDRLTFEDLKAEVFEDVKERIEQTDTYNIPKQAVVDEFTGRGIRKTEVEDAIEALEDEDSISEYQDGRLMLL